MRSPADPAARHARRFTPITFFASVLIALAGHLLVPPAAAQDTGGQAPDPPPRPLARWLDAQAATVAARLDRLKRAGAGHGTDAR